VAKINDYYHTLQMIDQLTADLRELESDPDLKSELEFERKLKDLISEHDKSPRDVVQVLSAIDPVAINFVRDSSAKTGRRRPRPVKIYENPHTGEIVETRGPNHKTLREWREQYGKETVQSWTS